VSYSIASLLARNLHDVFGENDPTARRAAIDEIFTEDCVFYDPSKDVYRSRDRSRRAAELPPFISFSTSYHEVGSPVRHPMHRGVLVKTLGEYKPNIRLGYDASLANELQPVADLAGRRLSQAGRSLIWETDHERQ
jgi:hypothetical protein